MMTQDKHAIAERPVDTGAQDTLNLGAYSDSLVSYIKNSVTPTTIAVQGDWGSGKTSLLNIVRNKLGKEYLCITFNTWQYSQFEMSESLAISFMTHFLSELKNAVGMSENVESTLVTLRNISLGIVKNMAVYTAGKIGGEEVKELVQGSIDSVESGLQGEDVIETLKNQIDACIEELLEGNNYQKIIVFIDDLDRLNPVKAVELMEIIKIFMDKEGCVYVLAVDTEVVKQGIVQKYGLDEEKSQAFFDKLIQLPFSMPVSYYDFAGYVKSIFPVEDGFDYYNDFFQKLADRDKEQCISFIQMVSGRNPRAAKRAVNAFVLQEMVWQNKLSVLGNTYESDEKERIATAKILLALTCIQIKLEPDYGAILRMVEYFPSFLKWINNKERIEIQDLELIQKYKYSEEQLQKYNRDKNACGKMFAIFKQWCMDYIQLHGGETVGLESLLRATNGVTEEQGYDYAPIAKVILSEFEKRLREYRKEVIWECLEEEKEAGTYDLWYDEAVEIWDVSKRIQPYLPHQKMLDHITELTRSLRAAGENVEAANQIMDFYNEIESSKFKFAYSKIVRENFKKVIGYKLTSNYKSLKKLEQNIEEDLFVTDVFFRSTGLEDTNTNRATVNGWLESMVRDKKKELLEADSVIKDMFDEIWERVEYTISKLRYISDGKCSGMSTAELSPLFSISVLLEDEETEGRFEELKAAMKGVGDLSREEKDNIKKYLQKTIWKDDVEERREIYSKLRSTFSWISDEKIKSFLEWMKIEDEEMAKYEKNKIPKDYEKRRLQWYFRIVSFLIYCHETEEYKAKVEDCRKINSAAWKCIFKAVDIAIEDYVSKASNEEKRNTKIFFGVTKEALDELQSAYCNADGWLLEGLPEGYKELTLGMVNEFLTQPKEVLESVQGSYELGMLIGRHFDEESMSSLHNVYKEDKWVYSNYCCFEKREDTFLWKYYETFSKMINQLRLNNVDVQRLLDSCKIKMESAYLLDSEGDFSGKGWTELMVSDLVSDVSSHKRIHKDEPFNEEIRTLYENIPWKVIKKRFAVESIYHGLINVNYSALRYFEVVGGLIYRDIPNFLNYLENGDEISGGIFEKASQARHEKFMRKYYETLKFLRTLAEG